VFLEINPAGQWLFVENATAQQIAAAALAQLLVQHDREPHRAGSLVRDAG
jgi:hypothetical protein